MSTNINLLTLTQNELTKWFKAAATETTQTKLENMRVFNKGDFQGLNFVEVDEKLPDINPKFLKLAGFKDSKDEVVFKNRILIPYFNVYGKVSGFVGYRRDDKTKYLFSKTYGFNQRTTFYGIHEIKSFDYCILTEGIFDALRLKALGFKNVMAISGSYLTVEQKKILAMFVKIIIIADNDKAGEKLLKQSKLIEQVAQFRFNSKYNDIDDYGKAKPKELKDLFNKFLLRNGITL